MPNLPWYLAYRRYTVWPSGQGDNLEGPSSFVRISSDKLGCGEQRMVQGKENEPYYNHSMY